MKPKKGAPNFGLEPPLAVQFFPEQKAALKALSQKHRKPISALIREMVAKALGLAA